MNDLTNEPLMTLDAARAWLGTRLGKPPSAVTLRRWVTVGVRGVVLEAVRYGGRVYVSVDGLNRFSDRLSGRPAAPSARRRAEMRRATEAMRVLRGD